MLLEVTRAAATELGITIEAFDARVPEDLEPAFDAMMKAGMQAMTPIQGGTAFQWRHIIPRLAIERRLPCAYSRETFEDGALLSYGADQIEMCYQSAVYADKILKGAKPSDIPVEQPAKFEFLVNLKTAKTLGLDLPTSTLLRANEVIE
jgi:putative ABC transport system substrate-binding protein